MKKVTDYSVNEKVYRLSTYLANGTLYQCVGYGSFELAYADAPANSTSSTIVELERNVDGFLFHTPTKHRFYRLNVRPTLVERIVEAFRSGKDVITLPHGLSVVTVRPLEDFADRRMVLRHKLVGDLFVVDRDIVRLANLRKTFGLATKEQNQIGEVLNELMNHYTRDYSVCVGNEWVGFIRSTDRRNGLVTFLEVTKTFLTHNVKQGF